MGLLNLRPYRVRVFKIKNSPRPQPDPNLQKPPPWGQDPTPTDPKRGLSGRKRKGTWLASWLAREGFLSLYPLSFRAQPLAGSCAWLRARVRYLWLGCNCLWLGRILQGLGMKSWGHTLTPHVVDSGQPSPLTYVLYDTLTQRTRILSERKRKGIGRVYIIKVASFGSAALYTLQVVIAFTMTCQRALLLSVIIVVQ